MKIKILPISLIFAALLALFFFIRECDEGVCVLNSDDGRFSIMISDEAFPEGVSRDDLSFRTIGFGGSYLYSLKPDGLQLNEPAKIVIKENGALDGLPILAHISDGKIEPLDNVHIFIDQVENTTIIEAEIDHFSEVLYDMNHAQEFLAFSSIVQDKAIGQAIDVSALITFLRFTWDSEFSVEVPVEDGKPLTELVQKKEVSYSLEEPTILSGSIWTSHFGQRNLRKPPQDRLENKPARKKISFGDIAAIPTTEFVCETPGEASITYTFDIETVQNWVINDTRYGEITDLENWPESWCEESSPFADIRNWEVGSCVPPAMKG